MLTQLGASWPVPKRGKRASSPDSRCRPRAALHVSQRASPLCRILCRDPMELARAASYRSRLNEQRFASLGVVSPWLDKQTASRDHRQWACKTKRFLEACRSSLRNKLCWPRPNSSRWASLIVVRRGRRVALWVCVAPVPVSTGQVLGDNAAGWC